MSGFSTASRFLSDFAHTMKAFIGRRMRLSLRRDPLTLPVTVFVGISGVGLDMRPRDDAANLVIQSIEDGM